MVKTIVKDPIFLAQKSADATVMDRAAAQDLLDTLRANAQNCVGMAANMIGVSRRIIAVDHNGTPLLMYNPEIISSGGPYEAEEGCLSLSGTRKTKRYRTIRVRYQDEAFQPQTRTFTGWTAQIIQHEVDHCSGILI